jgi:hypothetical protein
MKALLFLVCLLCANGAQAGPGLFALLCENTLDRTTATMSARSNGFTIDNTKSYRALREMQTGAPSDAEVLGMTVAKSRIEFDQSGRTLTNWFSGQECMAPRITVNLYYIPIVIYISREFSPGSCVYDEILAHEMRHLNAYLEHLPKVEATVRKSLTNRFDSKPLFARSGQLRVALQREINDGWLPYIKRELVTVEKQQDQIDTPQEYARLSRVCAGEVQSLIGPAQQTRR